MSERLVITDEPRTKAHQDTGKTTDNAESINQVREEILLAKLDRAFQRIEDSLDRMGRSLGRSLDRAINSTETSVYIGSRYEPQQAENSGTSRTAAFWQRVGRIKDRMEQDSRQEAARRRSLGG